MAIAKITRAGLSSIAVLVVVLWGCVLGEHLIVQRANREFARTMTEIRLLQKRRILPVSVPAPVSPLRPAIS